MNNDAVARWTPTGISGVMLDLVTVMWSSLGGRIDDVQADVRELRGEMSEIRGETSEINARVGRIDDVQADVRELRGEVSEISTRVGRIEGILEATVQNRASELTANAQ